MDMNKTRQQQQQPPRQQQQQQQQLGRLKGATRILSEPVNNAAEEQPNKQGLDVDSTTPSGGETMANDPMSLPHSFLPTTNALYLNNSRSATLSADLHKASSSAYIVQTSSASIANSITTLAPTAAIPNVANSFSQQQQFKSPQLTPCDIKSLFECPICFDYAVPPIYQCQNGHLVCQACSSKIVHCPTCRVPITEPSIRNLQLDRLANTFQFPCKFNFNGCQWKSYWFQKREHEETCDYVSYSCPCPGTSCKWTGLLTQVMAHLSEHHKSITTLRGEDIVFLATDINLKGAVDWVMIQSCFNQHFLLVLEKQESKTGLQQFFATVQLIGSQKEADKFKYRLELSSNQGRQVKRLQWEATPRSILEGIQVAIANYDCLVFDSRMAQNFLSPIKKDGNKKLSSNSNSTLAGVDNSTTAQQSGGNHCGDNQGENLGINVTIERIV